MTFDVLLLVLLILIVLNKTIFFIFATLRAGFRSRDNDVMKLANIEASQLQY